MDCNNKENFLLKLKDFVKNLKNEISKGNEWTIRGFIDIFKNIYPISSYTKIISKLLELHLFPYFLNFAENNGFYLELAEHQNWYPDLTFVSAKNSSIKFAVDLKTTYRDNDNPNFCNGFTLGSHGEYFIDRKSKKNVQYPYGEYSGHFCVGIIYSREIIKKSDELKIYKIDEVENIPAVINNFLFFAGEKFFDDYWANYGKLKISDGKGGYKKLSSFEEFLQFKGLSQTLNYPKKSKKKREDN